MGGVLKAGMIGEAPTLDLHVTTAVITQQITWHMYETLYTYDKNLSPIPMLAEGHAVADGGRRYTITLRKGVRFHNGTELTAEDVRFTFATLAKDGSANSLAPEFRAIKSMEVEDPHTLAVRFEKPFVVFGNKVNQGLFASSAARSA